MGQAHYKACAAQYCRLFKIAYGDGCTKPKHHFALHCENECSFDCFAGERKNQLMKAVWQHNRRGARREYALLTRAMGHQLAELEDCAGFTDRILPPLKQLRPGIAASKKGFLHGSELRENDVVKLRSGEVLVVCGFLDVSPDAVGVSSFGVLVVANVYEFSRVVTPHATAFAFSSPSNPMVMPDFELVSVSYFDGTDIVILS